jgi:hypothetical protein
MDNNLNRIKRLDLLGGIGAGVLGAGLALLFANSLQRFAVPALLIGIAAHGWAMFAKSRLERQASIRLPRWAELAERACWVLLAVLGLYVGYTLVR